MLKAALAGIATTLAVGIIGGIVAQQLWLASRQAIERRFAASSEATSSILSTALNEQLAQVDAVARALEAAPPGENRTIATDAIYGILANQMVTGDNAPFLGLGFARSVFEADAANWEAMATQAYGSQARVRSGNFNTTDGTFKQPLPFATNESAFALEHTYPVSFFAPNAGIDLASISIERQQALRRCQNANRLSLTGQVLGLNSRFPIAFFYAPVFAATDPERTAEAPARIVKLPSSFGPRPATDVELVPRGVLPDPATHRFLGVVAASTSASRLISLWKRIGGGITDVQVLMQDVTDDSEATECKEVSATLASPSTILEPSNATFFRSCRNGTMLTDQAIDRVSGFTASNAQSQSTMVTSSITKTAEAVTSDSSVTVSCARPELVSLAVADGSTVVDLDQSGFAGTTAGEIAKSQLRSLCERIQNNVAEREGTALRSQTFLDIGGRRMSVVAVAAQGFEAVNGQVSEGVAALVVVLIAVICGSTVFVSMAAMAGAERREQRKQKESEARLKVARTVHHTTVSYLAHEIRGGLSVSSIGAGLAAEGLREDGLRLTNGDVVPPDLLQLTSTVAAGGGEMEAPPQDADDGVFGAVSSVGLLRDLQRIQAASASSLRLIEDVLDIVGLETGKLSVKLSPLSPSHFMHGIADRYRPISAVPIRLDVGPSVPASILSDPLRCEQAVLNGLTNAIKHTRTGAIVVSLRIETIRVPRSWYRVRSQGLNFFQQAAANADEIEEDGIDGEEAGERNDESDGSENPPSVCSWLLSQLCCCAVFSRASMRPPTDPASDTGLSPVSVVARTPVRRDSESSSVSGFVMPTITPAGAARSDRTRSRSLPTRAPYLVVRITDNGGGLRGIDPDQLLRPFVSDKKAISRGGTRVRSTGLGLPIAAQVAELIGGHVSLADDGKGHTVYTVVIPLIPPRRLIDAMDESFAGFDVGHKLWRLLETGRAGEAASLLESEATGQSPNAAASGVAGAKTARAAAGSSDEPPTVATATRTLSAPTADSSQGRARPDRMEALEEAREEEEEDDQEEEGGGNDATAEEDTPSTHAVVAPAGVDAKAIPVSSSAVDIARADPGSLVLGSPTVSGRRTLHIPDAAAAATADATAPVSSFPTAAEGPTAVGAASPAPSGIAATSPGRRTDRASRQARREQRQAQRRSRREAPSSSVSDGTSTGAPTSSSSTLPPKTGSPYTRSLSVPGVESETALPAVAPGYGVLRGREGGPLEGMFVLCVDDEPMVLASTTRLLRRLGCHVVALQNPLELNAVLEFSGQLPPMDSSAGAATSAPAGGPKALSRAREHASKGTESGYGGASGSLTPRSATALPTGWTVGRGMAHGPASAVHREERPSGPGVGRFTCVFMDIIMPQRNGDEIASSLRESGFQTPIIAVTGNVAVMDIRKYSACGFNGVLGKPLDRDVLVSLLETLRI